MSSPWNIYQIENTSEKYSTNFMNDLNSLLGTWSFDWGQKFDFTTLNPVREGDKNIGAIAGEARQVVDSFADFGDHLKAQKTLMQDPIIGALQTQTNETIANQLIDWQYNEEWNIGNTQNIVYQQNLNKNGLSHFFRKLFSIKAPKGYEIKQITGTVDNLPFQNTDFLYWDSDDSVVELSAVNSAFSGLSSGVNDLVASLIDRAKVVSNGLSTDNDSNMLLIGEITAEVMKLPKEILGEVAPNNWSDYKKVESRYHDQLLRINEWFESKVSNALTTYNIEAKNYNDTLKTLPKTNEQIIENTPTTDSKDKNIDGTVTDTTIITPEISKNLLPDYEGETEISKKLLEATVFGMPLTYFLPLVGVGGFLIYQYLE